VAQIARLGLIRTFQQTRVYARMTCLENMLISFPSASGAADLFGKVSPGQVERSDELLHFVGLHDKRLAFAGQLSFGQQKLLELAMALMTRPKLLLLDEPTAGINPTLINGLLDLLLRINTQWGVTMLVIEHNMRVLMSLVEHVYCLAHGELLAEGAPEGIVRNPRVVDAYLGAQ